MKKKIAIFTISALAAAATAQASGYRIPEQSTNAIAMSNAYIAGAHGADASYYNPANMVWNNDVSQVAANLTYINLPHMEYTDDNPALLDGSSKTENFFIPHLYYSSKDHNNIRFGLALTSPFGLSKRWEDPFPKASAEEFTLQTVEANPTIAYKVNDFFALAGGARVIYAKGKVKSNSNGLDPLTYISRDLDGDTVELGYNLALSLKPNDSFTLGATYRSKIDLDLEGEADLNAMMLGVPYPGNYSGDAEVSAVAPAVLSVGAAYSFNQTTIELAWDRTFWSKYEELDFDYDTDFSADPFFGAFDNPIPKDWEDTDAFRIGLSHQCTDKFTAMAGFAIDETAIPEATLGFELPGSDFKIYSLGFNYQYSDNMSFGAAALVTITDDRHVTNAGGIDGEFTDGGAYLVDFGITYTY